MFSLTLAQVVILIKTYGYWLIFPIAFIEGPILAVICGWLVALGILNFFVVYVILITANLLGDIIYYFIGYYGGTMAIKKWGHWLNLDLDQTIKLKNHFDNHGGKILLTAKIVPHLGTAPVLAGAGLARYSFLLFLRYSLIIEIFKTAILVALGYFMGDAYNQIAGYFNLAGFIYSLTVVIVILGFIIYWYRKK